MSICSRFFFKHAQEPINNFYSTNNGLIEDHAEGESTFVPFLKAKVLCRAAYLGLALLAPAPRVGDLVLGIISSAGCVCTLGLHRPIREFAFESLYLGAGSLLSAPYFLFLKALSPKNRCSEDLKFQDFSMEYGKGLSLATMKALQGSVCELTSAQRSHFARQIGSRLMSLTGIIAMLFARTLETAAGLPFLPASLICLGKWEFANNMAHRSLQAPSILGELFFFSMSSLNPNF